MRLKIIVVSFHVFRPDTQELLKDGEIDINIVPIAGDVLHIDGKRYKVLQRDFVSWSPQSVKLFVKEIL